MKEELEKYLEELEGDLEDLQDDSMKSMAESVGDYRTADTLKHIVERLREIISRG